MTTVSMSAHQEQPPAPSWPPKRNKRKNFEPRCTPADSDETELDSNTQATAHHQEPNKIGVKSLAMLKATGAVDLSGRRISVDSNENLEPDDYAGPRHLLEFAEHQKKVEALRSLNISTSQFQQSYIQSLRLPNLGRRERHLDTTPNECRNKNFSTKSPFAISQLIKTDSPARRRDSNSDEREFDDEDEGDDKDDGQGSPNPDGSCERMTPDVALVEGQEAMDVDDCVEEVERQNGDAPNNNKVLRDYAVNTMKELLGIYGLSSNEVAEALTGQARAIEAMQAGKPYPVWLPRSWSQGHGIGQLGPLGPFGNQQYADESDARSPIEGHHRFSSIQDDSPASGADSDDDRTLDLSLSKDQDVQDLSTASSAGNSVAEFEHQSILMRRNIEELAGLHGLFSKPQGSLDPDDVSNNELRAKLSPAALLASLNQLDGRRQASVPALDYSRYVKRFGSALECGSSYCKDMGYREHFHCLDCTTRVFCKKEEMIRHFKWHKKRDESLVHGFMRYSPLDDCSERGGGCPHNRSQTHYHCIQDGCDKVYISTSDVQMHANYHRKDSAILQEGFQRFRATERCSAPHCAFRGQRTTHFHCRRPGCRYTFKNKADMEKHKTYHIKDEQLARDGFKKYMKNEPCPYRECRFSRMCNHIHCIRPRCNYVLHSSSQLFSHKRKHERKDQELNYSHPSSLFQSSPSEDSSSLHMKMKCSPKPMGMCDQGDEDSMPYSMQISSQPPPLIPLQSAMDLTSADAMGMEHHQLALNHMVVEEISRKYIHTFSGGTDAEDKCGKCSAFNKHYHCMAEGCSMAHSCQNTMVKHALEHEHQSQVTEAYFQTSTKEESCGSPSCHHIREVTHYHCTWENCGCIVLPSDDQPFRRLEHHRQHTLLSPMSPPLNRLSHSLTPNAIQALTPAVALQGLSPAALQALNPAALQALNHASVPLPVHPGPANSLDEMFSRKRGRPPKNRVVEVWADHATPQAVFTSFKLPKSSQSSLSQSPCNEEFSRTRFPNFESFTGIDSCAPHHPSCRLRTSRSHLHCARCNHSSDDHTAMEQHTKDVHSTPRLLDGFEHCTGTSDACPVPSSLRSVGLNVHFHCDVCGQVIIQYAALPGHKHSKGNQESEAEVRDYSMKKESISMDGFHPASLCIVKSENPDTDMGSVSAVVKAAGTFYPSSHDRSTVSPRPNSATCQHCLRPRESGHLCPQMLTAHHHNQQPQGFDSPTPGLAATKETLEREYPEISILPSTASSTPSPSAQRQTNQSSVNSGQGQTQGNQSQVPGQAVHSLLLQQYLAQATTGKPPQGLQDHLKYQQLGVPGLSPSQLAQMAFLSHRSPFPLYPSMMYPPELLMEQSGLLSSSPGMPSSSIVKNEKDGDLAGKRSHAARGVPSMRMLKDEPIPEGYLRFRFNEDCKYQHCGYREHQTHFHCTRRDCGYSFCDKTRFVQHTARHERLDTLMGGDFQQYRANVFCGRQDCAHATNFGAAQNKASHFHCLKCEFVCTDTNKVVAHRRQHQKMDSIQAAGFEKFSNNKSCGFDPQCLHCKKQTHYHCLQCGFAVLGLSQMTSHKYRHQENAQAGAGTSGTSLASFTVKTENCNTGR